MKDLLIYLEKDKKQAILAPLFKMLEALFDLFVPLVVADLIDNGIARNDMHYVMMKFLLMIALAVIGMLCSFTAQYFAARASAGTTTRIRQALFDHIQELSYSELDQMGGDTLITRITSDVNQIQTGLNLFLRLALRSPFIVFGSVIMAFTIDLKSALIFLAAVPVLAVVVFVIMLVSIPLYRKCQRYLDRILGLTRENLAGVRVIRAFRREKDEIRTFEDANQELRAANEFVGRIAALMNPLTYAIVNIATIILIYTGAVQVNNGVLMTGQVIALYNYMAQIIVELIKFANLIIQVNRANACAERVQSVLNLDAGMTFPSSDPEEKKDADAVVFDHVSFGYGGEAALSDISFTVKKGQTIGIIGGTGSGKSSLVNLIPRFYDVDQGTVYVDGNPVQTYQEETLRKKFGIVPQKAVLFAGTIRDNMKWGNEKAGDEDIEAALVTAQAKEVVDHKEGRLDYVVEQNGRNFSGGQKQRLTIARALVRKPEILILDDSSSALDFATDAALRKAIHNLPDNMTVFIVSQRISSIKDADHILVLDDGKLAGDDTHEELLKHCKVYQEIYDSQTNVKKKEAQA